MFGRSIFGIAVFFRNPHCKHKGKVVDYQVITSKIFSLSLNTVFCPKAENPKPQTIPHFPHSQKSKITCIFKKRQEDSCLHLLKKKKSNIEDSGHG